MRHRRAPLLVLTALSATALALRGARAQDSGEPLPARYVAEGGVIYVWDGASPAVSRPSDRGDLPADSAALVLRPYDEGRRLLVLTVGAEKGKERRRLEGVARTYDSSGPSPRLLATIEFDGEPFDAVVTRDGSRAYVLARRVSPGDPPGSGRYWVHEIDLEAGRLEGNTLLSGPPAGLTVDDSGRKLYVSLADRIQSCSTRPLLNSWIYRSPGLNSRLAVRSDGGTLCVARGEEIALFDPAVISERQAGDRHARDDDASGVVRLPFRAEDLTLSDDGRMAAVHGAGRLAFLDCETQSLTWPERPGPELQAALETRALAFPGAGRDLILALFPGGGVTAVRTPAVEVASAPKPSPQSATRPEPPPAEPPP
ncbi:MAG TPA: hypothetical protein VFN72_11160, partial [Solirubrobacterales bacterium]|nr:hypothetical protein [Solirubrobacterales bacterium]